MGNEITRFIGHIATELKNREVEDIFVIRVVGFKGFREAIEGISTNSGATCIVNMFLNSLKYVFWKDRKAMVEALKPKYIAATVATVEESFKEFSSILDSKYPKIGDLWRRNWEGIVPFLAYSGYIRTTIRTTDV